MIIAVAGKGGAGKTFVAASLARLYSGHLGRAGKTYAIDADPAGSLGAALGLTQGEIDGVKPIYDMHEFIDAGEEDGALYLPDPGAGAGGGQYDADADGVRFLRMAGIKRAGSGCYCGEHGFLRALVGSMLLGEKDVLIMDMGAGVEHLARGTAKGADLLLIVSEASRACVDCSRVIQSLGSELGVGRIHIVANKIRSEKEEIFIRAGFRRGDLIGLIRMSEAAAENAMRAGSDSATRAGSDSATRAGAMADNKERAGYAMPPGMKELFNNILSINVHKNQTNLNTRPPPKLTPI